MYTITIGGIRQLASGILDQGGVSTEGPDRGVIRRLEIGGEMIKVVNLELFPFDHEVRWEEVEEELARRHLLRPSQEMAIRFAVSTPPDVFIHVLKGDVVFPHPPISVFLGPGCAPGHFLTITWSKAFREKRIYLSPMNLPFEAGTYFAGLVEQ